MANHDLPPPTGTILDYLPGRYGDIATSHEGEPAEHPHGVLFQAPWTTPADGWAEHSRRFARALSDTGIPVQLRSSSAKFFMAETRAEQKIADDYADLAGASIGQHVALVHHVVPGPGLLHRIVTAAHLRRYVPQKVLDQFNACRVLSTVWERTNGVSKDDVDALNMVGQCWVATPYHVDMLARAGVQRDKLRVVPVPYFPDDPHLKLQHAERRPGVPRFYNIGKWEPRKEQARILLAFLLAFKPGEAAMLLKTSPTAPKYEGYAQDPREAALEALELDAVKQNGWTLEAFNRDVFVIARYVSDDQLFRLHEMGDVYVTLSRGEGFDMPAFDAKLAGKRMIYTPSGGPQSFADTTDRMVLNKGTVPCHPFYKWPAEAEYIDYDVADAVTEMRAAAADVTAGGRVTLGAYFQEFAAAEVGERMRSCLAELPGWPFEEQK